MKIQVCRPYPRSSLLLFVLIPPAQAADISCRMAPGVIKMLPETVH